MINLFKTPLNPPSALPLAAKTFGSLTIQERAIRFLNLATGGELFGADNKMFGVSGKLFGAGSKSFSAVNTGVTQLARVVISSVAEKSFARAAAQVRAIVTFRLAHYLRWRGAKRFLGYARNDNAGQLRNSYIKSLDAGDTSFDADGKLLDVGNKLPDASSKSFGAANKSLDAANKSLDADGKSSDAGDTSFGVAEWKSKFSVLPGLILAAAFGLAGVGLGRIEARLLGREWLEGLVLAILLGLVARVCWKPAAKFAPGVRFAAKPLLEVAIVLLGASVDAKALWSGVGPLLLMAVFAIVPLSIGLGVVAGRALGLEPKLALLVACGNSICGNSAIASVAPVILADEEQVAAAVAFTALGSVFVVALLPLARPFLALSPHAFGALAGLSVYAVPQVLAATAGAGALATQTATVVKLARVLMLGPVTLVLSLRNKGQGGAKIGWSEMVPAFIVGFIALAVLRTSGVIAPQWADWGREIGGWLTVAAMAALGLSSDPNAVRRAGRPVLMAAAIGLAALVLAAYLLVSGLKL